MNKNYIDILYKYFFMDSIFFIIIFILCLILLIVELIRKKRKKAFVSELIIMAFAFAGILTVFIPVQLDISKNSVIQVNYSDGFIYTQSTNKDFSFATPYIFETNENYNIELSAVDEIPQKVKNGTIIYSQRSRVLLDYTGKDVNDEQ